MFGAMKTFLIYVMDLQVAISHKVYSAVEIEALQAAQSCVYRTAQAAEKQFDAQ